MTAILQAGLLAVLLTVVTAELEYTAELANTLVNYQDLVRVGAPSLKYITTNPNLKVLLNRIKQPYSGGAIDFYVNTHQITENPDQAANKSRTPTAISIKLPGIRTALRKCLNPCHLHCCTSPEDNPLQNFEFREMHFHIKPNRNQQPYMKLAVEFYDSMNDQAIEVVMYPFKPPTNKTDEEHAKEHKVPTIAPPISLEELSDSSIKIGARPKNGKSIFVVDISWMDEVLKRAKYDESKDGDLTTKYTEIYLAGPVIFDRDAYNKILQLDPDYKTYASRK